MSVTSDRLTTVPRDLANGAGAPQRRLLPAGLEAVHSAPPAHGSELAGRARAAVVTRIAVYAQNNPNAVAVSGPHTTLTYHALFSRALELSARLHTSGVRRGDLVALCLPRSADFVVGALSVLISGAAYVALDPDQPDARLRFMVEDCGASVLLADNDIAQRARWQSPVVPVESDGHPTPVRQLDEPAPGAAAYAVYTSGSTGTPKGVLVPHAGLLNLIAWHQRTFGLTRADRTTLIANPGFDAAVWEIWPTLTAGASLHVPPDGVKTDPVRLRNWLVSQRITVCFVPTPLAETLMSVSWPSSTALRWLLTGGDVLHHRPPADLPFSLVNNYGVSEASVVSTSGVVGTATPEGSAPNIGAPIDGVTLRVIDEHGNVVPDGVEGELLICGDSVAIGYLGSPELTAQKFVTDPCNPAVRAYRTGDRVRVNADHSLEFLGRLDGQIQIRGVRVETRELVEAAHHHPEVAACAATALCDGDQTRLALFVVARQPDSLSDDHLRAFLRERLPEQMVPALIVAVPDLPVTANGKIDHAALAEFASSTSPAATTDSTAARSDVEAVLAETIAGLLKRPNVGVDDNFFLLGGHSMLGAQLIVRIAELYGVEVTLLTLFDHPTVAELAAQVERMVMDEIADMSDDELLRANDALGAAPGGDS